MGTKSASKKGEVNTIYVLRNLKMSEVNGIYFGQEKECLAAYIVHEPPYYTHIHFIFCNFTLPEFAFDVMEDEAELLNLGSW